MNCKSAFFAVAVLLSPLPLSCDICAQEIPQKEIEQLDFAQGLLARGLYDMAISEYQKFIAAYPQSTYLDEANSAIGECYFLSQDFPQAIDAFNHFKELYPNSPRFPTALLRLGQSYIQQKKYDEALKELTSIDREARLKGQMLQSFYFYIAEAYRGKNDSTAALDYFQKTCEVKEASLHTPYAFQEIAEIAVQNAQYKEAIEAYLKAAQAAQQDSLKGYLIYKLGETQFLSGNYAEAINQFHQVLEKYSTLEIAKDALTNALLAHFNLAQYDELLTEYQNNAKFIKEEGPYFDIHFVAARAYRELKKYDEAVGLLDQILSFPALNDGNKRQAILKKADIFIKQKKYQEGVALLEGTLAGSADDADEISFLKAQGYYGLKFFEKAFNFFQEVKNNHPSSSFAKAAVLGMAHAAQESGNYKEAADRFLEYYNSEQDENLKSEAFYDLILMEVKLNAIEEAARHSEEYLKTFPRGTYYEQIVLVLGDLYAKSNQSDEAVGLLQQYLTQPQDIQRLDAVYFLLGYNQQLLGRWDQALDAYGKISHKKEDPKFYSSALINTATIYLRQKKDNQAAVFFDRMITELDKNDLPLHTYLWICDKYLKEKKFNDVLRIMEKAERNFPNQSREEIAYFKAEAYRELKNFDNAQKFYEAVLSSATKNMYTGAAHIGKGLSLVELKKFDEAKSELQKAIDENADDHTITLRSRFEIGNIAAVQKNFEEALKFYLLVGTIYDDDYYCPESLLRAAGILENLNRKGEALKIYQGILDKYKDRPVAAQAKERMAVLTQELQLNHN